MVQGLWWCAVAAERAALLPSSQGKPGLCNKCGRHIWPLVKRAEGKKGEGLGYRRAQPNQDTIHGTTTHKGTSSNTLPKEKQKFNDQQKSGVSVRSSKTSGKDETPLDKA